MNTFRQVATYFKSFNLSSKKIEHFLQIHHSFKRLNQGNIIFVCLGAISEMNIADLRTRLKIRLALLKKVVRF